MCVSTDSSMQNRRSAVVFNSNDGCCFMSLWVFLLDRSESYEIHYFLTGLKVKIYICLCTDERNPKLFANRSDSKLTWGCWIILKPRASSPQILRLPQPNCFCFNFTWWLIYDFFFIWRFKGLKRGHKYWMWKMWKRQDFLVS